MKRFQIFKPGRHTASNGATMDFSEDMLKAAVAAYDPALHEAPITVGHPKDNAPAYGWIKSLDFDDSGAIVAEPQQVEADFGEMVQAGRFKKRSASWYLPDSPNNPKPGTLYLRHVAFLGAQPPAIKGLKEVNFSEDEGIVEFSESGRWAFRSIADMMRSLREWIISEKGIEAADTVTPAWRIDDVARAADAEDDDKPALAMPAFSEEENPMTIEELKAQVAALTAERDTLKANQKPADFAEREANLAAREAAVAQAEAATQRAAIEARVDAAVKAGRILPAQKKSAVDFAMGLAAGEATIDFGEGDKVEKVTQREAYIRQIEAAPKVVDYDEHAAGGGTPPATDSDPAQIADKARAIVKKAEADGKVISYTEAVAQVYNDSASE